jgi:hypothetical protein
MRNLTAIRRRARARDGSRSTIALLGFLYLLTQGLLPHVHLWQQGTPDETTLHAATEAPRASAVARPADATHHDGACPVCQALAHSAKLVPSRGERAFELARARSIRPEATADLVARNVARPSARGPPHLS